MEEILIHGLGSIGRLLYAEMASDNRFSVKAFVCDDKYYREDTYAGKKIYKASEVDKVFSPSNIRMISTGIYSSLRERYQSYLQMKEKGYNFANYISPKAIVADDLVIGHNNIVFAGVYLDYFGKMGDCNVIRPHVYIGHEFNIGNGMYISPNCSIAGQVTIEDLSFIGIGATVLQKLTLAKETLIGAASLVTKSTEPYSQYIGLPAKKVKTHQETGILL